MLNPDLLNNKELSALLLRSMKECELFADENEIPVEIYKDIFVPIYTILGLYLKEQVMLARTPYMPQLDFISWDELVELRYNKYRHVQAQSYEQAAKLRDRELKLITTLNWIEPFNRFLELFHMIPGAENTYLMLQTVLNKFEQLYTVKIEGKLRELLLLCSDKLLLELYNHHGALDRSVYNWQLAKWENRKVILIGNLKIM